MTISPGPATAAILAVTATAVVTLAISPAGPSVASATAGDGGGTLTPLNAATRTVLVPPAPVPASHN